MKNINNIIIIDDEYDIFDEEALYCTECLSLVMDSKECDACSNAICKDCRYYDENIIFCVECFLERQRKYEEDQW